MKMNGVYNIEHCYSNGDLVRALAQAGEFIERIGDEKVYHVIAYLDPGVIGAWWVDVVYMNS